MESVKYFVEVFLPLIGGFIAVSKWIYEYTKQLNWERNKYLIEVYHNFLNKKSTNQIHKILDYNSGIPFNETLINDEIVQDALVTHDLKEHFNEIEYEIRNCFDEYFDNLTELIILGKCGLIDIENLKKLLGYYFNLLKPNSNKTRKYTKRIYRYLDFYNYKDIKEFLE